MDLINILKNIPMVDDTTAKILSNYWQNNIKMFADFANKARDVGDEQLGCFYYYNQAITELEAIVNVEVAESICAWCRDRKNITVIMPKEISCLKQPKKV